MSPWLAFQIMRDQSRWIVRRDCQYSSMIIPEASSGLIEPRASSSLESLLHRSKLLRIHIPRPRWQLIKSCRGVPAISRFWSSGTRLSQLYITAITLALMAGEKDYWHCVWSDPFAFISHLMIFWMHFNTLLGVRFLEKVTFCCITN